MSTFNPDFIPLPNKSHPFSRPESRQTRHLSATNFSRPFATLHVASSSSKHCTTTIHHKRFEKGFIKSLTLQSNC